MIIKPNELLFLNYINGMPYIKDLPDYWKFSYGIEPNKVSEKLIAKGLVDYRPNIEAHLNRLTIPQLKDILRANDLELKGNKKDLISRILGNVDVDLLSEKFPEKIFCLTQKGFDLINTNYLFIVNQKERYGFTDQQIIDAYNNLATNDTNQLIHYILIEDIKRLSSSNKWYDYEMRIYQLAKLYFKVDNYVEALKLYIVDFKLRLFNFQNENFLREVTNIYFFDSFIAELKSIVSINNCVPESLIRIISEEKFTQNIPFKYFDDLECHKILCDLLSDKKFESSNYKINRPNKNSTLYKYYGFDDDKVFNTSIHNISSKKGSSLSNFFNTIFGKK